MTVKTDCASLIDFGAAQVIGEAYFWVSGG